ncbi:MAG: hypothetical protein P8R37_12425 [Opitutae bacterium]|nr:hypothetical protein [Opitutae bacterium]
MPTNPTGQGKARISLVVDEQLKGRIGRAASENQMSMNAYIEGAISEALRVGLQFERRAVYATPAEEATDPKVQAIIDKAIAEQQQIMDAKQARRKRA